MLDSERIDGLLDQVKDLHAKMPEHPKVFTNPISVDDPATIADVASQTAAQREYVAESLSRARKAEAVAAAMVEALRHDISVELDRAAADQAQILIARGYAWREREAKANLSVLEHRVEFRGVELKMAHLKALVQELDDCYRAWRDTEWSIDRQVRLLQLRHAIGEV